MSTYRNKWGITLRFSAASPDSKLIFQLSNPIMYFLSPVCMWEELRFCPARWGEPATQLMFSLIWVGWLTPPGWAESMFLSHKMSGKIKTSQEIKYIMGLLSWNINFESGDAAEILTVLCFNFVVHDHYDVMFISCKLSVVFKDDFFILVQGRQTYLYTL